MRPPPGRHEAATRPPRGRHTPLTAACPPRLTAARPPRSAGEFVESASIGRYKYGTSVGGIDAVRRGGRVCLLDLDVQGVQALVAREGLDPYCVWVAPPSLEALRTRLERRGSDDEDEISRRLRRARDEIEFSLTARCFSKIIVNDDLDVAYAELKEALLRL